MFGLISIEMDGFLLSGEGRYVNGKAKNKSCFALISSVSYVEIETVASD